MEGGMDGEELKRLTKEEISRRIREGVKAVIEQVLEEEMTEHLAAGYRERTESRRGERNGYYTRDLITRRPPFHPPSGDGGASWGQLAAVRGALYGERFKCPCIKLSTCLPPFAST
jgi:hypothetical protein